MDNVNYIYILALLSQIKLFFLKTKMWMCKLCAGWGLEELKPCVQEVQFTCIRGNADAKEEEGLHEGQS